MPEMLNKNPIDHINDEFEERWVVILSSGGKYILSKNQARLLQKAIASGNRGVIMFQTFAISIPYIVEFYLEKRFRKGSLQLPAQASEEPYQPISKEKFEEFRRKIYKKLNKAMSIFF